MKNLGHILEEVSGRLGHLEINFRKISCFCLLLSQKYFDYPRGPGLVPSQYRPSWALLPAWYQPPTACFPAKFQPQWVLALPHRPCSPSSACFNLIFPLPVASLSSIPLLPPPSFTLDPSGVVPTCRLTHPPRNPRHRQCHICNDLFSPSSTPVQCKLPPDYELSQAGEFDGQLVRRHVLLHYKVGAQ